MSVREERNNPNKKGKNPLPLEKRIFRYGQPVRDDMYVSFKFLISHNICIFLEWKTHGAECINWSYFEIFTNISYILLYIDNGL